MDTSASSLDAEVLFSAPSDLHHSLATRPLHWEDFVELNEVSSEDVLAVAVDPGPRSVARDFSDVRRDAARLQRRSRWAMKIAIGAALVIFGVLLAMRP